MENDNHENYGDTRNTGRRGLQGEAKRNHCYCHTPSNTKGAKTSNSGVERNTIRYNRLKPFGPFRVLALGSVCRVQSLEGRYHLCYLCLGESLAGKQDHNQQVCVGTVGLSVC